VGQGRTTTPRLELESLEGAALLQDIRGNTQVGRQGLGFSKKVKRVDRSDAKGCRQRLIDIMKQEAEDKRMASLHGYEMQTSVEMGTGWQNANRPNLG
jgi:hypothetical protein